ncbi:hypothetical protein ETAA8_21490 [Anatilimnocola aggregata]|uniref:Transposase n=1 Tax=Anatilimnocola aggregata TaxID=2528021 RepID=A0A517Y9Z7_9BACT|nr:hypothetical protein ETAA8_21490 [Anatilimnocola aggregata]
MTRAIHRFPAATGFCTKRSWSRSKSFTASKVVANQTFPKRGIRTRTSGPASLIRVRIGNGFSFSSRDCKSKQIAGVCEVLMVPIYTQLVCPVCKEVAHGCDGVIGSGVCSGGRAAEAAWCSAFDRDITADDGTVRLHDARHFLTSIDPGQLRAEELLAHIRNHWQIENCVFFAKDRWWDEDRHCTRRPASPNGSPVWRPPPPRCCGSSPRIPTNPSAPKPKNSHGLRARGLASLYHS